MAVDADELVFAHVDIDALAWVRQAGVQIPVLDCVTASSSKVAAAAVVSLGPADTFCGDDEIHALGREPAFGFSISARPIMAHEAIGILGNRKVVGLIYPSISGVTRRAGGPVALDPNTEIVDEILLADFDGLTPAG
jgi:hypothetical protein